MSEIKTRPATDEYRDGWDAVFNKEKEHDIECDMDEDCTCNPEPSWTSRDE